MKTNEREYCKQLGIPYRPLERRSKTTLDRLIQDALEAYERVRYAMLSDLTRAEVCYIQDALEHRDDIDVNVHWETDRVGKYIDQDRLRFGRYCIELERADEE